MNVIILFIVCTAVNVILSTVKSILTVKGNKWAAATMNAITYGFYSYVIILTNIDGISTLAKMGITAACNFVGVFIVKLVEEKARKDKLWEVRGTLTTPTNCVAVCQDLDKANIPYNYIDVNKYIIFNCYCATQADSAKIKKILNNWKMKYFVSESKSL